MNQYFYCSSGLVQSVAYYMCIVVTYKEYNTLNKTIIISTLEFLLIQVTHMTTFQSRGRRSCNKKIILQLRHLSATRFFSRIFQRHTIDRFEPSRHICGWQPLHDMALHCFLLFRTLASIVSLTLNTRWGAEPFCKVCNHPTSKGVLNEGRGCWISALRPLKAHGGLEAPLKHVTVRNVNTLLTSRKSLRWHRHVSVEICQYWNLSPIQNLKKHTLASPYSLHDGNLIE